MDLLAPNIRIFFLSMHVSYIRLDALRRKRGLHFKMADLVEKPEPGEVPEKGDEPNTLKIAGEICFKCGVCCVIRDHSCHAQYDAHFTSKYTFVYDCLGSRNPAGNPNIWLCVSCHKCEEICPYEEIKQIVSTGYAFPLTRASSRQRDKLGLKSITPRSEEDLRRISVKTGLVVKLQRYEVTEI
jgi:heterodisulfide reductase subunit C